MIKLHPAPSRWISENPAKQMHGIICSVFTCKVCVTKHLSKITDLSGRAGFKKSIWIRYHVNLWALKMFFATHTCIFISSNCFRWTSICTQYVLAKRLNNILSSKQHYVKSVKVGGFVQQVFVTHGRDVKGKVVIPLSCFNRRQEKYPNYNSRLQIPHNLCSCWICTV